VRIDALQRDNPLFRHVVSQDLKPAVVEDKVGVVFVYMNRDHRAA
jgi:hypothetical protein